MNEKDQKDPVKSSTQSSWFSRHRVASCLGGVGLIVGIFAGVSEVTGFSLRDLFSPAQNEDSTPVASPPTSAQPSPAESSGGGWGPERSVYSLASGGAPYAAFNCIIDNTSYGDERNFLTIRDITNGDRNFVDRIEVQDGHEYEIRIYINNCGPDKDVEAASSWIHDAKALLVMSTGSQKSQGASAYLTGSNVTKVWDSVTLWNNQPFTILHRPGNFTLYSNAHPPPGLKVSADLLTSHRFRLGYREMDGKIRPGYQFATYIYAKVGIAFG